MSVLFRRLLLSLLSSNSIYYECVVRHTFPSAPAAVQTAGAGALFCLCLCRGHYVVCLSETKALFSQIAGKKLEERSMPKLVTLSAVEMVSYSVIWRIWKQRLLPIQISTRPRICTVQSILLNQSLHMLNLWVLLHSSVHVARLSHGRIPV